MDYAMSQLSRMQIIYIAKGRKEKDICKLGLKCDGNRCPHNRLKIHLFDVWMQIWQKNPPTHIHTYVTHQKLRYLSRQ